MKQPLELSNHQFNSEIKISLFLHVSFLVLIFIKASFFQSPDMIEPESIRVDMVALPDRINETPSAKTIEEKSKVNPVETPKEPDVNETSELKSKTPKFNPDAVNLDKNISKQKNALDKLKQLDALEKLKNEVKQEAIKDSKNTKQLYKGNVIASGSSLTGINQLQADSYKGSVLDHMKRNWEVPQYLKKGQLTTWVLVKFDVDGNILSKTIVKTSGNQAYDEVVLKAIDRSSPVPAPPNKFVSIARDDGFLFKFSPEK